MISREARFLSLWIFSMKACQIGAQAPLPPAATAYGALLAYATDSSVADYQPMHVNFGIMESLDPPVRNKRERYKAYAQRGEKALQEYARALRDAGLLQGGE